MLKLSIALVLLAACGDNTIDQGADAGAQLDAGGDAAGPSDARAPDARPVDAEILGDCAVTCAGEDLSTWDSYEICRPSYHHCRLAPRCADICDAATPLTCSSSNNCQCHQAIAVITCVAGDD